MSASSQVRSDASQAAEAQGMLKSLRAIDARLPALRVDPALDLFADKLRGPDGELVAELWPVGERTEREVGCDLAYVRNAIPQLVALMERWGCEVELLRGEVRRFKEGR